MNVAEVVGCTLAHAGVTHVFGVVGSGNFEVTAALIAGGARFVAARHEGGAATMADAYARMSAGVSALTVHQGCGLTNATTGIAEAAKSRTPMVVLAAEAASPLSNFFVDQPTLAASVGAASLRIDDPASAQQMALEAVATAYDGRRTVLLSLPLEVQGAPATLDREAMRRTPAETLAPLATGEVDRLISALRNANRPVFIAGRGSRGPGCREALEALANHCGALVATSAVAKGLFVGNPWSLDISGGFATPLAAEVIASADLIVGWGCALNMWTTRHGRLIAADATVVQIDDDHDALGAHRDITFGVTGDVRRVAQLALERFGAPPQNGYRTATLRAAIAKRGRWQDEPYEDTGGEDRIDPRTLCTELDTMLPAERLVAVDSGNFMGYPSMYWQVPDEFGFCFTQAFQSVGLGLATTIGAALAHPDRLPVAALGDGGALMSAAELETVVRLGIPMVIVVFDDHAYGAEVHHFRPSGKPLDIVTFPDTDLAAIARGYGFETVTVRRRADLTPVANWVAGTRDTPLLIDAKIVADEPSWWLADAFGH